MYELLILVILLVVISYTWYTRAINLRILVMLLRLTDYNVIMDNNKVTCIENRVITIDIEYKQGVSIFNVSLKKLIIPDFKVIRRGIFEIILDNDDGDIKSLNTEYKIYTPFPRETHEFISKREPEFFKVFKKYRLRMVIIEDVIKLRFRKKFSSLTFLLIIADMMEFHMLLALKADENYSSMIKTTKFQAYTCYQCKKEIAFSDLLCVNCDTEIPVCIICLQNPQISEKISMLGCCESYCHTDHLDIWLTETINCPYCGKQDPLVISIVDITSMNEY